MEIDGGQYAQQAAYDAQRTRFLEDQGFRVLRFWNNQVLQETESLLNEIAAAITAPHPEPLLICEEGENGTATHGEVSWQQGVPPPFELSAARANAYGVTPLSRQSGRRAGGEGTPARAGTKTRRAPFIAP